MAPSVKDKGLRFELDTSAIQRAVYPYLILTVIAHANAPVNGLSTMGYACALSENIFSKECKAFPSVLYPLLEHMENRKWIKRSEGNISITPQGRHQLKAWKTSLQNIAQLLNDLGNE